MLRRSTRKNAGVNNFYDEQDYCLISFPPFRKHATIPAHIINKDPLDDASGKNESRFAASAGSEEIFIEHHEGESDEGDEYKASPPRRNCTKFDSALATIENLPLAQLPSESYTSQGDSDNEISCSKCEQLQERIEKLEELGQRVPKLKDKMNKLKKLIQFYRKQNSIINLKKPSTTDGNVAPDDLSERLKAAFDVAIKRLHQKIVHQW
ncbi:unnamed protein product [Didymodactylos carnosus]|uniref:Uncharacterized protein n=1 Tax=Didymodactylos carnosus TaxID=1234261 RepID=A0A816AFC7_9BILA|nr:unnamed protein product [Didymodactylos carnosus]CAF1595227.1 unnamed protein product [Didymodactylos carnosus]CAF4029280.1 unnamed protein product [Didymodactylos carnosus]CAF4469538.1 unnamed protein product [Didymodactylos carnosus]